MSENVEYQLLFNILVIETGGGAATPKDATTATALDALHIHNPSTWRRTSEQQLSLDMWTGARASH
jgi:hypothetical protein